MKLLISIQELSINIFFTIGHLARAALAVAILKFHMRKWRNFGNMSNDNAAMQIRRLFAGRVALAPAKPEHHFSVLLVTLL